MSENRLGRTYYFDNNFVGDRTTAAEELRALDGNGWIYLARTDTLASELSDDPDSVRRQELLDEAQPYPESFGAGVWDHAKWSDGSTWGTSEDDERLGKLYRILFPESNRHDTDTNCARRKIRDAMHLATAIKYGADGFITRDRRDLLSKAAAIAAAFNGFAVVTPEDALEDVLRLKARYDYRQQNPL